MSANTVADGRVCVDGVAYREGKSDTPIPCNTSSLLPLRSKVRLRDTESGGVPFIEDDNDRSRFDVNRRCSVAKPDKWGFERTWVARMESYSAAMTLESKSVERLKQKVYQFVEQWSANLAGSRRVPDVVYHYCDANALVNIFKTRRLWATGHRYLNDRSELTAMFRDLPKLTGGIKHPAAKLLTELSEVEHTFGAKILGQAIGMEHFCTCFSANGDLLSQWRAYADDGRGFAVGFQTRSLKHYKFRRMLYASDQTACLKDLFLGLGNIVKNHLALFKRSPEDYSSGQTARSWLSVRLGECLSVLAFQSKDDSFKEEDEWRLYASSEKFEFRVSNGKIVPYTTVDMSSREDNQLMPVREIILGPRNDRLDTERVLMYMASEYGYGHGGIEIYPSKAPYR